MCCFFVPTLCICIHFTIFVVHSRLWSWLQVLELDSITTHHWLILGCSAVTGENLLQGIDWTINDIASRIFTADWQISIIRSHRLFDCDKWLNLYIFCWFFHGIRWLINYTAGNSSDWIKIYWHSTQIEVCPSPNADSESIPHMQEYGVSTG